MAVLLSYLLILTGFTGIHSINKVSKVSVKAGESISIPCLYDQKNKDLVKYLCKRVSWRSCLTVARTDEQNSEKFSISDDKNQSVFTVTIKNLTEQYTDYWCYVEKSYWFDDGAHFQMAFNRDTPSLRVDRQEITAVNGENVTINCYYNNSGEMKWCRLGGLCVAALSGTIGGIRVIINASVKNVFTVSMSGLTKNSSGWYLCVSRDLQMPVHVMVMEKRTTHKNTSTDVTPLDFHFTSYPPVHLMSFIVPLTLLVLVVMVTLFIWFLLKRHKQTTVEPSAIAMMSNAEMKTDVDVIYSLVLAVQQPTEEMVEHTYCTLE